MDRNTKKNNNPDRLTEFDDTPETDTNTQDKRTTEEEEVQFKSRANRTNLKS